MDTGEKINYAWLKNKREMVSVIKVIDKGNFAERLYLWVMIIKITNYKVIFNRP